MALECVYFFFLSRQNETVTNEKIAQHAFIQHELEQRIEFLFLFFLLFAVVVFALMRLPTAHTILIISIILVLQQMPSRFLCSV